MKPPATKLIVGISYKRHRDSVAREPWPANFLPGSQRKAGAPAVKGRSWPLGPEKKSPALEAGGMQGPDQSFPSLRLSEGNILPIYPARQNS